MTITGLHLSFQEPSLRLGSIAVTLAGVPAAIISYSDDTIVVRARHTAGNGEPAAVVVSHISGAFADLANAWSPLAPPATQPGAILC